VYAMRAYNSTMPRTAAKDERLHLRVDAATKQKLLAASAYEHQSISDFVLAHAVPAADRVLEAHVTVLSSGDWDVFLDALTSPPEPTEALRKAFKRHKQQATSS